MCLCFGRKVTFTSLAFDRTVRSLVRRYLLALRPHYVRRQNIRVGGESSDATTTPSTWLTSSRDGKLGSESSCWSDIELGNSELNSINHRQQLSPKTFAAAGCPQPLQQLVACIFRLLQAQIHIHTDSTLTQRDNAPF